MASSDLEKDFICWAQKFTKGSNFPWFKAVVAPENVLWPLKVKSFLPVARDLIHHLRPSTQRNFIRRNLKYASILKYFFQCDANSLKPLNNRIFTDDVKEARRDNATEAKSLKEMVLEEAKLLKEEKDLKHQIDLLDIAVKKQEIRTAKMKSWLSALDQLLPQNSTRIPQDESIKLDTAGNDLKIILTNLQELKSQLLKPNKQDFHERKLLLWHKVQSLLNSHNVSTLMKRLIAITVNDTFSLDSATQHIDLASDARELRLRYSEGCFIEEISSSQGVVETMESMLVEMSGKHINRHFWIQKKNQETNAVIQILKNNRKNVEKIISELYPDTTLGIELLALYDLTLLMAGLKASLANTSSLGQSLNARAGMAHKAKEDVTAKFEKIHCFEDQVRNGLANLKAIALSLNLHQGQLDEENGKVNSFIEQTINTFSLPMTYADRSLIKEVDFVLQIPCDAFMLRTAPVNIVSSESLSLQSDCMSNVIPYLITWEQLLHMVKQKKQLNSQKKAFTSIEIGRFEFILNTLQKEGISTLKLKDLVEGLKSQNLSLEKDILLILVNYERSYPSMKESLKQLEKAVDEWWSQPSPVIKEYLKG